MSSLQQSQELASGIASVMHSRIAPYDLRGSIAAGSFDAVSEHHRAVNLLIEHRLIGSGLSLLRPMYDGCIVGLWATYVASETLLEQFEAGRFTPEPHKVIKQLKRYDDGNYVETLQRVHEKNWKILSTYVHGGNLQVSRRNTTEHVGPNYTEDDIQDLLAFSNAMAIIAAMEIPDLTNDRAFFDEMIKVINKYVAARRANSSI